MENAPATSQVDEVPHDEETLLDIAVQKAVGPSTTEPFSVRDHDSANWLVRRVVETRRYRERVKEWAAQEMKRAESQEERLLYLFGGQLRSWVTAELASNRSRAKSINLPAGACGFRQEAARVVINDERMVLEWAKEHCPAAVIVEERLVKRPVNDHVSQTGELPPGTSVQEGGERFFIR